MAATENAVEAHGLLKRYGAKQALAGVDLEVPRGSVCALLGPNGAGKTTAVRVLATLTEADEGTAIVAGHDVRTEPVAVRRSIGLAAQDATVDGLLSGGENLTMIGELHHLGRRAAKLKAQELLERFSLLDAGDKLAKEYSGGMRRRLDLAATLVAEPEVLFLDEPTTGLDPRGRNELWGVLDDLTSGGSTILLTTQYLEEADRLADEIVVVDHGRVIARGDARSLKREVGGDQLHVVCLHQAGVEETSAIVARIADGAPIIDAPARSVSAPTDGGASAIAALAAALEQAGVEVEELALRQPTLDDVFLTLTGSSVAEAEDSDRETVTV
jgi:ABC-2 type transport system ATP-binding protein